MNSDTDEFFAVNKATWNTKVGVHAKSEFYGLEAFKEGQNSLNKFELEALGDIRGKSILHLQCHFGQDTLSLARMGAEVTGVDISDKGIEMAKELSSELGLDATFVCCNVLDTAKYINNRFDIVFTSYGVIGWLPDLKPWGEVIAQMLKPGGTFYMIEFHPIVWMFDHEKSSRHVTYSYSSLDPIYEEYEGTYADQNSGMISKEYGWNHGISDIIKSLTDASLTISELNEYYESPYNIFPELVESNSGCFRQKEQLYPLLLEIVAVK